MDWITTPAAVAAWLLTLSTTHVLWLTTGACAALLVAHLVFRALEGRRAWASLEAATRLNAHVAPASLHPVIDPDICIGSGSCISACPEGKILGLVGGVATLVDPASCIGHGRCAAECPVSAIRLVMGSQERGIDLPEVDSSFETSRPGVHVIGELGGMGLIKNALIQGLQVSAALGKQLLPRPTQAAGACETTALDLVIVGAGPAGIAAAVGARAAGLRFAVVEQDTVGGAVAHYPRQKLVMSETVDLPFYGRFGRPRMSKEDLVRGFAEVISAARIEVHEGARATAIRGEIDDFTVLTSKGVLRARRVVLAIGRRGVPRQLAVPGNELSNVTYRLVEANQYQAKKVLVVGGGDTALEAAIMLAEQSTAEVVIAHRRAELMGCRPLNRQKLDALAARGRVRKLMSTELIAVQPHAVVLKNCDGAEERIDNDFVIACLGGALPVEFLKALGVGIRRHRGDRAMANPALGAQPARSRLEAHMPAVLAIVGTAILAVLAAVGNVYYLMPRAERYRAIDHLFLKPSGAWGHGVGLLATAFMLLNFAYPVRKRLRWLKRKGPISPWLRFHVFVGLMSPAVILFHSAFQWGNQLATATYLSLVAVVVTGLIGRFIYGWCRLDAGASNVRAELRDKLNTVVELCLAGHDVGEMAGAGPLTALVKGHSAAPTPTVLGLFSMPGERWRMRSSVMVLRPSFLVEEDFGAFRAQVLGLHRVDMKVRFHEGWKRLMRIWRVVHVTTAIMLLALIGMHIWISARVGLKWFWF